MSVALMRYIQVSYYAPNEGKPRATADFGPYANINEAEKNLRKNGWEEVKPFNHWVIPNMVTESGDFITAMVERFPPCNSRNLLPKIKK